MGGAISGRAGPYNQGDITIAVAGQRGVGKSTFINTAAGSDILPIGHNPTPTSPHEILPVECIDPGNEERRIFFVEVPTFDCESVEVYEKKLKQWLRRLPPKNQRISGILYLHRITDVKISANGFWLKALCENTFQGSPKQMVLVTTKWGLSRSMAIGAQRETECRRYWDELTKDFVASHTRRFEDSFESAWSAVADVLENPELIIPVTISGEKISFDPPRYKQFPSPPAMMKSTSTGSYSEKLSTPVHFPDVLGDHRQRAQTLPNEAPSVFNHYHRLPSFSEPYTSARVLISEIIKDTRLSALVAELCDEEAQYMVDFMNVVLREEGALANHEGKYILALLSKLARTAQVFPRCYELKGVEYDSIPKTGGGFADIYKGTYQGKAICLKIVRLFEKKEKSELLKAHVKELILWAHLRHQNILPFYGVYLVSNGRICIASPWMNNGDLSYHLDNFPGSPRNPLVSDIITGLLYLHRSNIVHGDLKAKNVLVSDYGRALLADFGISTIVTATGLLPNNSIVPGSTPRWAAPEVLFEDVPAPTRQSDIWSLGCLLYEIYTRKPPFYQYKESRMIAVLQQGQEIPMRPPVEDPFDNIDDRVWELMAKCWSYRPESRPSCEDIEEFFEGLQFPDDRPPIPVRVENSAALGKAMKAMSDAQVDHEHALEILRRIRRTV